MTPKPEDLYPHLLAQQGITLAPERADALAATLASQVQAERAATRTLGFEREPAVFIAVLEGGGR
jgi:hypothetical protein